MGGPAVAGAGAGVDDGRRLERHRVERRQPHGVGVLRLVAPRTCTETVTGPSSFGEDLSVYITSTTTGLHLPDLKRRNCCRGPVRLLAVG